MLQKNYMGDHSRSIRCFENIFNWELDARSHKEFGVGRTLQLMIAEAAYARLFHRDDQHRELGIHSLQHPTHHFHLDDREPFCLDTSKLLDAGPGPYHQVNGPTRTVTGGLLRHLRPLLTRLGRTQEQ